MRAMLKRVLGWDQRTEAEKAAFREWRYHPLRALGVYLGFQVISLSPIPLRFKRLAPLYVEKAVALGSEANSAAIQAARHAVTLYPNVPGAMGSWRALCFRGKLISTCSDASMTGCGRRATSRSASAPGTSIVLAQPPTVAVGIDPEPRLLHAPKTVCKIFPLASDDYFAVRDPRRDIEAETVDLAFIDGLHLFEQVLRDFINIERVSSPTTLVLIHDCFAIDALTAERNRKTEFWTGDVWKIIPCLREFRPDLQVFTIATRAIRFGRGEQARFALDGAD